MRQIKDERKPLPIQQGQRKLGKKAEKEIIQQEALMLLQESPYRELWEVACDFHEGELTLQGRVPTYFLKQVAQSIVFVMERVEKINNLIEVFAA